MEKSTRQLSLRTVAQGESFADLVGTQVSVDLELFQDLKPLALNTEVVYVKIRGVKGLFNRLSTDFPCLSFHVPF